MTENDEQENLTVEQVIHLIEQLGPTEQKRHRVKLNALIDKLSPEEQKRVRIKLNKTSSDDDFLIISIVCSSQ